jgi:Tol biopolymer transport system component
MAGPSPRASSQTRGATAKLVNLRKVSATNGHHSARWSPDGRALAFVDAHATYVASADSFEIRRIRSTPAGFAYFWTAAGDSLVYRTTIAGKLQIQRLWIAAGTLDVLAVGNELTLPVETEPGVIEYRDPAIERNQVTTHAKSAGRPSVFAWQKDDQVFVSQNGAIRQITTDGSGRYFLPTVSPSGGMLFYYELSRGLFIADLATGRTRNVGVLSYASWSKEGDRLICVDLSYENDEPIASRLMIVNRDGELLPVAGADGLIAMRPSWSPDGRMLAFDSDGTIYVAELVESSL